MDSSALTVRRLGPADAAALLALRREALETDPVAFSASPADDRHRTVEAVRESLEPGRRAAVLGAFDGASLAGMAGVVQAQGAKRAHKALVWGMYVTPRLRGRGLGARLLEAAIAQAREWPEVEQVQLGVTESAAIARRLYESAGFREWGREPGAVKWEGRHHDALHLVLELR